jgi:hypothetical protein
VKVLKPDAEVRTADGTPVMRWVPAALPVVPAYPGAALQRGEMNDLRPPQGEQS